MYSKRVIVFYTWNQMWAVGWTPITRRGESWDTLWCVNWSLLLVDVHIVNMSGYKMHRNLDPPQVLVYFILSQSHPHSLNSNATPTLHPLQLLYMRANSFSSCLPTIETTNDVFFFPEERLEEWRRNFQFSSIFCAACNYLSESSFSWLEKKISATQVWFLSACTFNSG